MQKIEYDLPVFNDKDVADLNEYSNEMASALKIQINNTDNEIKEIDKKVVDAVNKFGNPLSYKGQVSTIQDLPTGATNGDIYNVTSENKNYIYNGTEWVEYSSSIDLTYLENATKTTQTTEVSEALTIENCAPVSAKLDIVSGKSIQEGEPSPDNIIPIRNVGEDGSVDFKVENKNLVKNTLNKGYSTTVNGITYTIIENGAIKVNGTSTAMSELKINTDFSIKKGDYVISGGANNIMFQLIETGVYSKECYANEVNFTLNEDKTSQILRLRIASGETVNATIYPMIRQKGTSNNYIEHQEQIVSFPFTEGQVLHKGDYLAEDGIHQKRKTLVLDGTENIVLNSIFTNTTRYYIEGNPSSTNIAVEGFCSHYEYLSNYTRDSEHVYVGNTGRMYIFSTLQSVAQLKEFLTTQYTNGTPVTIEYELAEEIVIPYTTEQKQAYYELQHLLMYEGYTSIECIDEIKPDIQLTYWYNNELNKSYGERFDKVEDSINKLEKSDIYSTEEQKIGKWIDGKPLYRKVIEGTFSNTLNWVVLLEGNIKHFHLVSSAIGINNRPLSYWIETTSKTSVIDIALVSTNIQMRLRNVTELENVSYEFIIEYTKTTD